MATSSGRQTNERTASINTSPATVAAPNSTRPPVTSVNRVPRPPSSHRIREARAAPVTSNPYTITWPPSSGSDSSTTLSYQPARTVSRQDVRRNALERSRRTDNS